MVILLSQRSLILILCNLDFNTVTEVGNPAQPCGCLCNGLTDLRWPCTTDNPIYALRAQGAGRCEC